MSCGFISETYSGSVKIAMGFNADISIPQANVFGKFCSKHFSITFLDESGILRGWNDYRKIDGLL